MASENGHDDLHGIWQSQKTEGFKMTAAEIQNQIVTVSRKARRRNIVGFLACGVVIAGCIWWLPSFHNLLPRIGSIITILACGYIIHQIWSNQIEEKSAARAAGNTASIEFFRAQLERQRDFHRGKVFWSRLLLFVPGPLLFMIGYIIEHPEVKQTMTIELIAFILMGLVAITRNFRTARDYQRQIAQIDRFQVEA